MEKITFKYRGEGLYVADEKNLGDNYGDHYSASDVDDYRAAVKALVEAGVEVLKWEKILNFMDLAELRKAIAAVERLEG